MVPNSFQIIKATKIVQETTDAYMYENYGEKHWLGIACFLLEQGLNQDNIVDILRSKHMRWSSDVSGESTLNEFKYYCEKYPNLLTEGI